MKIVRKTDRFLGGIDLLLLSTVQPYPKYSVVVPVFNRPDELAELLHSLTQQTIMDFEVIVVEDGSDISSKAVCDKFRNQLELHYYTKANTGPGPSRNFGVEKARGEYVVFFDSDCILPPTYFACVETFMQAAPVDAWGGPDRGHENFTPLQQAMAYTMSSWLTTGGIRGGKPENFQPRSFNMGIRRSKSVELGGFAFDRLAEDIELSIRMRKAGMKVVLIPDAFVYHKRRTDLIQFFHQVSGFGRGRVRVGKVHAGYVKLTHWFPFVFMVGLVAIPVLIYFSLFWGTLLLIWYKLYSIAIFASAWRATGSAWVALLSVPSAVVQLCGYGWGFILEMLGIS